MSDKQAVLEMIRQLPDNVHAAEILSRLESDLLDRRQIVPAAEQGSYAAIRTVSLIGQVDENHRLTAEAPPDYPPGTAKLVLILNTDEDLSAIQWSNMVLRMRALDFDDPREVNYTLEDGEPVDGGR